MIETFAGQVPTELLLRSGRVFYSGRLAFSAPTSLYVLGLNPGGDPSSHDSDNIADHTPAVLGSYPNDWSAYRDESWEGKAPGSYGMAPRVLHLFTELGLNPGQVPCSNLIFARSRREGDIAHEMKLLADQCWPFHALVIELLRPKTILCFGKTAGNYVRSKVGADKLHSEFIETNNRRWRSQVFISGTGMKVVVATHPSIADWIAPNTDPTQLIRDILS